MNTSILAEELAPLNAQIEQILKKRETLEKELRVVEAEIETFSADRQRYDALRDVCNALDKLGEVKADELFWDGIPDIPNAAGHLERLRGRIARFEVEISGVLETQATLQNRINQHLDELDFLYEEVRNAHDREDRRQEEFVIEREISPLPYYAMIMPWTKEAESERRFRRAVLIALLICFFFGSLIPLVEVPIPDRSVAVVEIPERLAMLVKKERPVPKAKPEPKPTQEEPKPTQEEPKQVQEKPKSRPEQQKPDKSQEVAEPAPEPKVAGGGPEPDIRKKAESVGVLAFKNTFADLMDEVTVAKLGTEARLSKDDPRTAGQAVAQRSLVTIQGQGGSSGGIGNARFSRNVGSGNVDRLGGGGIGSGGGSGAGFARVASGIADLQESSRPLSDGPASGRTDEEIQIVFDRYKAALYRIYNTELRKDPTLRGKILLRICIETGGEVSMCQVESTDLGSPSLVNQIVERIKRFNFGPKEGVPKMIILYPIDFLPAA